MLFCAAAWRDSVSLLRFLFRSYLKVFSFFFHLWFQVCIIFPSVLVLILLLAAVIDLFCSFKCSPRVFVLTYPRNLQCWQIHFLLIFLIYTICLCYFLDIRGAFNKFPDFFVQAFKIVVESWKFSMLLLYILWDDWPIFMISVSNE